MLILLLYLALAFTRPFDLFPWLAPLHLLQIVGVIGVIATIGRSPLSGFSFRSKQLYLTLLFLFLVTISPFLTIHWIRGTVETSADTAITLAVFLMTLMNVTTTSRLRALLALLSALAVYLAIQSVLAVHFGFFRDILVVEQRVTDFSDVMISRVRATGFMMDPNDLAQTFVMAFPFLGLLWRRGALPRNLLLVIFPMMLLAYAIYLTHSRGAILSLVVIVMVAVSGSMGKALGVLVTAAGILGAMALNFTGGRGMGVAGDTSARARVEAWSAGIQYLKAHPFVGIGVGHFAEKFGMTAHNSAVLCFAELGFPTFCVWVGLMAVTFLELRAVRKLKPESAEDLELQRQARAIQLSLYAFLTTAWFLSRTYIVTLYLLIAVAAAVGDIARRRGKRMPSLPFPKLAALSTAASVGLILAVYATIKLSVR